MTGYLSLTVRPAANWITCSPGYLDTLGFCCRFWNCSSFSIVNLCTLPILTSVRKSTECQEKMNTIITRYKSFWFRLPTGSQMHYTLGYQNSCTHRGSRKWHHRIIQTMWRQQQCDGNVLHPTTHCPPQTLFLKVLSITFYITKPELCHFLTPSRCSYFL